MVKMCQQAEHPEMAAVGCSRQVVLAEEAVVKGARAAAVGLAEEEAGWVVMVDWEVVKGGSGLAVADLEVQDWVEAKEVAGLVVGGVVEETEETGLVEVKEAWAAAESCAQLHRTGTRYRSRNQLCGCTEHQIQKRCILYQSAHRASAI